MLAFTSWFIDDKLQIYSGKKIIKLLAKLYKPIANYRLRHLNTAFLLDIKLAEIIGF
jgi:hypothetical protein